MAITRTSDRGPGASRRLERLRAAGKPLLIELESPFSTDLAQFLRESGRRSFRTSASSFQLALESKRVLLADYHRRQSKPRAVANGSIPYVFHDLLGVDDRREGVRVRERWRGAELERWSGRCPPPDFFVQMSTQNPLVAARVAFGPAGTHSGLHRHGASTCQVLFGSKRWVLHDFDLTSRLKPLIEGLRVPSPQTYWWDHVVPRVEAVSGDVRGVLRRVLLGLARRGLFAKERLSQLDAPLDATEVIGDRFVQRPGQIVYLPPFWGHATINDDWTLAFVQELKGDEAVRAQLRHRASPTAAAGAPQGDARLRSPRVRR